MRSKSPTTLRLRDAALDCKVDNESLEPFLASLNYDFDIFRSDR